MLQLVVIMVSSYLGSIPASDLENRIWKLEQAYIFDRRETLTLEQVRKLITIEQIASLRSELEVVKDIAQDSKRLVRDGTTGQPSILARIIHNEDELKLLKEWQKEHKNISDTNSQLWWALGVSIAGHFIMGSWAAIQWWVKRETTKNEEEKAD